GRTHSVLAKQKPSVDQLQEASHLTLAFGANCLQMTKSSQSVDPRNGSLNRTSSSHYCQHLGAVIRNTPVGRLLDDLGIWLQNRLMEVQVGALPYAIT